MSSHQQAVKDRELERQGRRLGRAGRSWLLIGSVRLGLGIVLVVVGVLVSTRTVWEVGIALLLIGGGPAVVSIALLLGSAVTRWAARRKLFA